MKKANFDALKNLPTPEGWVEKALAIPEKEEKAVVIPFWRRKGVVALAASLVLVSVLSIALFMNLSEKPPVAVKPHSTEAAIPSPTDADGKIVETATDPTNETGVTESASPIPSQNDSESTAPTIESTRPDPTTPTQTPTEKAPEHPTQAPDPTEKPSPTQTPQKPTEAEVMPSEPVEPPTEVPWEPPTITPSLVTSTVGVYLPNASLPQDGRIFCKLVSAGTGKVYGDFGDYDDERLMTRLGGSERFTYYQYNCKKHFAVPFAYASDECIIYIYDSDGHILMTDSCYLGSYN